MFNKYLLLFTALLLLLLGVETSIIRRKSARIDAQQSIALAVTDSLRLTHDRLGREVAEKRGIQASLKAVEANYRLLTANQQLLVRDIQLLPRSERRKLVAASEVRQQVTVHVVDSVRVPSRSFRLAWRRHSDTLAYRIHVQDSTLTIDTLSLPNRIFLAHYIGKDKALHVTATNSNPMFRTSDVDAIIPPAKRRGFFARLLAVFAPE